MAQRLAKKAQATLELSHPASRLTLGVRWPGWCGMVLEYPRTQTTIKFPKNVCATSR
jgi:hypothetical protein